MNKVGRKERPPTKEQLTRYDALKQKKVSFTNRATELGVSLPWLTKWKSEFEEFCSVMDEKRKRIEAQRVPRVGPGRPKGTTHISQDVKVWERYGMLAMSMKDIAALELTNYDHIQTHLVRNPDCKAALAKGRVHATGNVVASLYKRAVGYKRKKKQYFSYQGIVTDAVEHIEHIEPDVNAQMSWLVNQAGWKRSDSLVRDNNKGAILDAIENMIQEGEDDTSN